MEYKDKIKKARMHLSLTQIQLAKELGCTLATVERWENGDKSPGRIFEARCITLCEKYNIRFEEN